MIGVLGGGQLGRMLALAGYPLGLRFRFLDPAPGAPAGQMAEQIAAAYDDADALARFADGLELVTWEWENVPVATVRSVQRHVPVYPPPEALEVAQDRLVEKQFFQGLGIPTPSFAAVETRAGLDAAIARLGLPAILKTRRLGYDGKGQVVLRQVADVEQAWAAVRGVPSILEAFIPFDRELSILAARGRDGATAFYPLVQNEHQDGMLRCSLVPVQVGGLQQAAESFAQRILDQLNYVGVLALELFEVDGELVANEFAPRVHNSGHWTMGRSETSQFENHLRAVRGLPLGSTAVLGHAGLVNIIGIEPRWERILAVPGTSMHWYGKQVRPGRKLGHVTVGADDPDTLQRRLAAVRGIIG
ncbi:MAG TPA: 5-(carboxyamino)imidazole ribonucleotide synthase [Herpetosiphonaceae bacterium]|nr:5-(carboxyamino)imidazole ribonucleotide synthase [Herpetosiphonaceae bacterium]